MGNKFLAKARAGLAQPSKSAMFADSAFSKQYPYLAAFMFEIRDEHDKPRKTCSVTVFVDAGTLKACLSEPNEAKVLFVTADTVAGLWDALEGQLSGDAPDWRAKKEPDSFGKKR